jgi:hypothetical protein
MRNIILLLITLITFITYSQDYPIIKTDSIGNFVVVMTIEQAQVLDNKAELLSLFEKMDVDVNNYNNICLEVINNKDSVIIKQDLMIDKLNKSNNYKEEQILNLNSQVDAYFEKNSKCEEIISNKDKEIKLHEEKISEQRTKMIIGAGIAGTVISGLIAVILFI